MYFQVRAQLDSAEYAVTNRAQIPLGLLYGFIAPIPLYLMHRLFPR